MFLPVFILLQCITVVIFGATLQEQHDPNRLFRLSDEYNGRRYGLARRAYNIMVADAQAMCQRYGGYLAEFDTNEEFFFARNFIMKNVQAFTSHYYIVTGGTDGINEGQWINRYGLNRLAAPNWAPGEPNNKGTDENCQCFIKHLEWKMNDCNCNFALSDGGDITSFLCEFPE
ncbi:Mannose-binding protein C [Bulinus truncatus]|nr:Mannose-binding protein C [Bulinus truncatus]